MDDITLSALVLEIATSQLGVREQPLGSNDGPQVRQYLQRAGGKAGDPWCMAFVYWSVDEAAKKKGIPNPLVKTPGVMDQWRRTKARKQPPRRQLIKPGDIFIMSFDHEKGHTGIVEKVVDGLIYTIEGNTNNDGSREGYEVARRHRAITSIVGVISL